MYLFWINFKLSLPFWIGAKILNWELFLKHQSTTSKHWSNTDNVEEDIFKNFKKSLSIQFFIWSPDSYKFPLILHCYLFKYFFQCLPLSSILQFLCDLCRHFSMQFAFCWCAFSRVLCSAYFCHTFKHWAHFWGEKTWAAAIFGTSTVCRENFLMGGWHWTMDMIIWLLSFAMVMRLLTMIIVIWFVCEFILRARVIEIMNWIVLAIL